MTYTINTEMEYKQGLERLMRESRQCNALLLSSLIPLADALDEYEKNHNYDYEMREILTKEIKRDLGE